MGRRQLGDKGRRGAKVVQRDRRMSDSEEHLRDNMHVCIVSFTAITLKRNHLNMKPSWEEK